MRIPDISNEEYVQEIMPILSGPEVDRFNRFQVFLKVADQLSDRAYWWGLRNAYASTDGLWEVRDQVRKCFRCDRPEREYLMLPDEREYLEGLPENVPVYRAMGVSEARSTNFGLSWTFSAERAIWYRDNYFAANVQRRVIMPLEVRSSEIIAYFGASNEEEVIIDLTVGSNRIPEDYFIN